MKKFYIASSFLNKEKVREAAALLRQKAYCQTYDWTANLRAASFEELKLYGDLERKAVLEADFLVVILPAGKGSHIELGIALGQGKPIYLFAESGELFDIEVTSTFYHLPEVTSFIGSLDKNIDKVIEIEQKAY